jgi:hypothetical protein
MAWRFKAKIFMKEKQSEEIQLSVGVKAHETISASRRWRNGASARRRNVSESVASVISSQ